VLLGMIGGVGRGGWIGRRVNNRVDEVGVFEC
jgi:hypothetical protein